MKHIIITIICVVCVGGGAFYGGMMYQKSQRPSFSGGMPGGAGGSGSSATQTQKTSYQPIVGTVSSADASSLTVRQENGSSRIVLSSSSTKVSRLLDALMSDIKTNDAVTVLGTINTDGTVTAASVSLSSASSALQATPSAK
jgi:hypothetical protein